MRKLSIVILFILPLVAVAQFTDSNLPIVVINTVGGVTIPDAPKVDATMGIIYNGEGVRNYLTDPYNEYYGNIGIERRGSSSQGFPKKQYGLETRDGFGTRQDVSIFDMAPDNDWVLFAPYSDKSLMRNALAYEMGWQTGQYAPRTKFCEVVLNGSYEGVYIFTEKIKRKDGKVGTDDVETYDTSPNQITGDYIFKIDKQTSGGVIAWTSPYPPVVGSTATIGFQMHDPDIDSITSAQLNYLQNYVTDFETALIGSNFTDPVLGYQPYVDLESFVDFMLVNEVSKNVDGYRISTYLHKLGAWNGDKLHAGPLWDFNLAFGNANYCDGGLTSGWEINFNQICGGAWRNPFWWERLVQDPEFTHLLNCRYQELRQGAWHTDTLMARIDTLASYLDESQQRNFQRWPILGQYVWPNNFIGNTYAEEVNYLKTWLTARLSWMDLNMFGSCNDLGMKDAKSKDVVSIYPNPGSSQVKIRLKENWANATVRISDAKGLTTIENIQLTGKVSDIDITMLPAGVYFIQIYHSANLIYNDKLIIIR